MAQIESVTWAGSKETHLTAAAVGVVWTTTIRSELDCFHVVLAFGLSWIANSNRRTVEKLRIRSNRFVRLNKLKHLTIGSPVEQLKGLLANGIALSALHRVAIVVNNRLERTFVDHGLVLLDARSI